MVTKNRCHKRCERNLAYEAEQMTLQNGSLIGQGVGADEKNSAKNIALYYQAGIGLPDRDYYFKTDPATQTVVDAYKTYLFTLCKLTGDDSASAAKKVALCYDLEKQMAASHRTNVELRDPQPIIIRWPLLTWTKKCPLLAG